MLIYILDLRLDLRKLDLVVSFVLWREIMGHRIEKGPLNHVICWRGSIWRVVHG